MDQFGRSLIHVAKTATRKMVQRCTRRTPKRRACSRAPCSLQVTCAQSWSKAFYRTFIVMLRRVKGASTALAPDASCAARDLRVGTSRSTVGVPSSEHCRPWPGVSGAEARTTSKLRRRATKGHLCKRCGSSSECRQPVAVLITGDAVATSQARKHSQLGSSMIRSQGMDDLASNREHFGKEAMNPFSLATCFVCRPTRRMSWLQTRPKTPTALRRDANSSRRHRSLASRAAPCS